MPLNRRILQATFTLPPSNAEVTLDQTLDLRVKVSKAALSIQNRAEVTVFNLSESLRQQLLTQFSAWNVRQIRTGGAGVPWCPIQIYAGYETTSTSGGSARASNSQTINIFNGSVIQVDPVGAPPNQGFTIQCLEHQIDKTQWLTGFAPTRGTYQEYVQWAGEQMGVDRVVCNTSHNDDPITNPFAATHMVGELLVDIQNAYRPHVAAFIDNNVLYVLDLGAVVASQGSATIEQFVGMPIWDSWGVKATTLFNQGIQMAGEVTLNSKMNPGVNRSYIVNTLDYDLNSRDEAFYVTFHACPPA